MVGRSAAATIQHWWDPSGMECHIAHGRLIAACTSPECRQKMEQASRVNSVADLAALGNAITAVGSVPTAIASFSLTPDSYADAIGNVILLGGDTDTLAAMAGAVSGAHVGIGGVPA